jgi:hypothetical protein
MRENVQTAVLSDSVKKALKSTVLALRHALEDDLGLQLKRLGLDPTGSAPVPLDSLAYLTEQERRAREALDAVLAVEESAATGHAQAVEAIRREAAYTHLNRLVGLKCLELRGHLSIDGDKTEAVTCRPEYGGRSRWLWVLRECDARYRFGDEAEETLWREGLTLACAAVSSDIRVLFDPDDAYAQVWPSYRVLRECIDALNALPEEAFRADALLGWVYQYFQTDEKARVFDQARTQKKKITGADIIPVTQLYTEQYMVEFLLQNSIGTRWMSMYGGHYAASTGEEPASPRPPFDWPYYVTPATPHALDPKPLRDWALMDPAIGSGHFAVVAFDMLAQLYAEERRLAAEGLIPAEWATPAEETARTILERNLYGIDIDARAVQIATLALYLKGVELGLDRPPRMNVVAADASFMGTEAWTRFLGGFEREPSVRRVLEALAESLKDIREIGSLLQPEVELQRIIAEERRQWEAQLKRGGVQMTLFPEFEGLAPRQIPFEDISDEDFWENLSYRVESAIDSFLHEAHDQGELVEQVVAGQAQRGFAFLRLCQRRYDVVCTNPPYMGSGGMGDTVKSYLSIHYFAGRQDLYASFILRCRDLAVDQGQVAMVTQQSWMFMRTYADLRAPSQDRLDRSPGQFLGLLRETSLETLAHLGSGAFAEITGEIVNTVLFTLCKATPGLQHRMVAFRLVGAKDSRQKAASLSVLVRKGHPSGRFQFRQSAALRIDGAPLAYWLTENALGLFSNFPSVRSVARVSQGLSSADNARFVHYWWETLGHAGWVPFDKGGGYKRWYGNRFWEVDWGTDGEAIKDHITNIYPYLHGNWGFKVQGTDLYF